jgi:hypothetical protein
MYLGNLVREKELSFLIHEFDQKSDGKNQHLSHNWKRPIYHYANIRGSNMVCLKMEDTELKSPCRTVHICRNIGTVHYNDLNDVAGGNSGIK